MEAAKEHQSTGLLDKILPPRLEDAGLEDCALPPDSIKEAFLKAATAVKSRATSIFTDDDDADCVQDPWPEAKDFSDHVVVGSPGLAASDTLKGIDVEDPPGLCVIEKGRDVVEKGRDEVVVGGGDILDKEKEKACVDDALKGLKIGDNDGGSSGSDDQEDNEGEKPILTEGFV
ncbi:uncharacterized protein [Euphorbia lathyris]|uniref:uncharacterized protein n=1 Tax=Euphorbia lathyris TaxID=212925 RepID=UPI0033143906